MKNYTRILLAALMLSAPVLATAQISLNVSVNLAPPVLPVYVQPAIPDVGYLWTPGYWAWGDDGYYWVPGTWILPPTPGYLWTPGYWGADGGAFIWHEGYWGPTVGFYGGINYGFGYGGVGFQGGYWRGGRLYYNRSVNNFGSVRISNVYNRQVTNVSTHVSYNGGSGGIRARPSAAQLAAARGPHAEATADQRRQIETARSNPALQYRANHGRPAIAATAKPGDFNGAHVAARGAARTAGTTGTTATETRTSPRPATNQRSAPAQRTATDQRSAPDQRTAPSQREGSSARPEASAQRAAPARAAPEQRAAPAQREQRPPQQEQRPPQQREPARPDDREHH
jgi:hypothetical protein